MHRTFRSLITLVVALSILLAVPISAGARGPEAPQPTLRAADGWLSAAIGWLQDALSAPRHLVSRHPAPASLHLGLGSRAQAGWLVVIF
jgi:hypothetical protein